MALKTVIEWPAAAATILRISVTARTGCPVAELPVEYEFLSVKGGRLVDTAWVVFFLWIIHFGESPMFREWKKMPGVGERGRRTHLLLALVV